MTLIKDIFFVIIFILILPFIMIGGLCLMIVFKDEDSCRPRDPFTDHRFSRPHRYGYPPDPERSEQPDETF